jgi:hypothetical protein
LRHLQIVLMVLAAMFIVAVPTAVAQSPAADQYTTPPDAGSAPSDDSGNAPDEAGGGPATTDDDGGGNAPVEIANVTPAAAGKLPFTGGQISLIALLGLGLLALGVTGVAVSRRRGTPPPAAS